MSPARLLEHFGHLIDTPDAVPRLRRFILDLAVRGKLVEQDPKDEPAGELLTRIEKEKSRLTKAGTIRTPKPQSPMTKEEIPFGIPKSWRWVRLGEVGAIVGGGTPPSKDATCFTEGGNGIAWLTPADLGKHVGLYVAHGARDLTEKGLSSASAQLMSAGSVLFTSRAPIGYTAIAANVITTNQGFKSVVPFLMESNRYIAVYFTAFATWINGKASGTTFKEVSGKIVGNLPFPLPPIAEQHRVVAKVDELMALCDELEAAQTKREKRRDRLVAATLHGLNNGNATPTPGAPSTFEESARFYFNHLPRLTTRPEHIHQLRQTILNLAVRGKLVPQSPEDEPASHLLKRIGIQKAKLAAESKIGGKGPAATVVESDWPYKPPSGWSWVRWDSIALKIGDVDHKMPETSKSGYPYVSPRDFRPDNKIDFEGAKTISEADFLDLSKKIKPDRGDIIYPRYGTIGENRLVQVQRDFLASYSCAVIKLLPGFTEPKYQYFFSISDLAKEQAKAAENKATQPNVGIKSIKEYLFPLPPLAEQERIVAKVDELMALCDGLESGIARTMSLLGASLEANLVQSLAKPPG